MSLIASASPRRPLKTRGRPAAQAIACWLAGHRVTPNGISLAGMVIAAAAGACLALVPTAGSTVVQVVLVAGAAVLVQLRLACNMLDGVLAVERSMGTRTGPLFNEVPDRIADVFILVGAGYAIRWVGWGRELGWLAGVLAVLTAYVRLLGGSLGLAQRFSGPMAKPHRMAVLTVACLASIIEVVAGYYRGVALTIGLVLIAIGSALTFALRLHRISASLGDG